MPMDSPLLAPGGMRAMPSPGVAHLKEAFDVTYAVHRMEEEGRNRQKGRGGFLQGLNEVDEDEADEQDLEATKRRYGAEVSRAIEQKRRDLQDSSKQRGPTQSAADAQRAAQNYAGYGGADRKQAEAALYRDHGRAGQRDRGRKQRGIDLSLDAASILSRRKKPMMDGQQPQQQQSPMRMQIG